MYFLVKVKYTKQLENGAFKRVSESYLVGANASFTDAEARIYEELSSQIRGEFIIMKIDRYDVNDIFNYDDSDIWYLVKISYMDLDSDREIKARFLITADATKTANERIKDELNEYYHQFEIISVQKSNIVEIFPIKEEVEDESTN